MSIFGFQGADPEQASGVLQPPDSLDHPPGVADVLDTGWSPPERPWAVEDWGMTEWEERVREGLAARLAREIPERGDADADGDGLGDTSDTDGELIDDEVGDRRAGRLVDSKLMWGDIEPELLACDVGIDGAAASAEEAAMHVVGRPDDDPFATGWITRWY